MVVAGLVAAGAGLVITRTSGLAFSMLTLAVAQALYTLVFHNAALGGENGLPGLRRSMVGPLDLNDATTYWFVVVGFAVLGIVAYRVIVRSPFGYALRAIREDAVRATYLGINVRRHRLAAFVMAGCGGGVAGALFAFATQIVTPELLYWTQSGNPIMMALIGGSRSFLGPVVGALVFTVVVHQLSQVRRPPSSCSLGLIFLFFLTVLPEGLVHAPAAVRRLARRPPRES